MLMIYADAWFHTVLFNFSSLLRAWIQSKHELKRGRMAEWQRNIQTHYSLPKKLNQFPYFSVLDWNRCLYHSLYFCQTWHLNESITVIIIQFARAFVLCLSRARPGSNPGMISIIYEFISSWNVPVRSWVFND